MIIFLSKFKNILSFVLETQKIIFILQIIQAYHSHITERGINYKIYIDVDG